MNYNKLSVLVLLLFVTIYSCIKDDNPAPIPIAEPEPMEESMEMPDSTETAMEVADTMEEVTIPILPLSELDDQSNPNGWVLNEEISDEFEAEELDETKWLIQGRDGVYQSNFIGRAPSQFSTENVRLEEGKLKLETKWDSDFNFSDKVQDYGNGTSYKYENITTAAVISKKLFQYGYMEIKCKVADASITSSFWTTGNQSELDIFEFIGKPKQSHKKHLEKEYKFSIHDWSRSVGGKTVWTDKVNLDWRVADGFHIYGCDWSEGGLRFFADGQLIRSATIEEMEAEATEHANGSPWVLTKPLRVWVDSETFPWHGLPVMEDLPVDFEIEYIRVWEN